MKKIFCLVLIVFVCLFTACSSNNGSTPIKTPSETVSFDIQAFKHDVEKSTRKMQDMNTYIHAVIEYYNEYLDVCKTSNIDIDQDEMIYYANSRLIHEHGLSFKNLDTKMEEIKECYEKVLSHDVVGEDAHEVLEAHTRSYHSLTDLYEKVIHIEL